MDSLLSKEEEPKPYWSQPQERKDIADAIWREFDKYRTNRDRIFSYFRERNCIEYWNDSDMRFNNYREKPEWKEEWQSNVSDITTHSKVVSIGAQVVANRLKPEFYPKFSRDIFSKFKAQLFQNIYDHTETTYRNGDLDDLFTVIETAKKGTSIWFEGWLKTKNYEGIVCESVPLEDFYPQYLTKFRMEDQDRCVWRSVVFKADADKIFEGNEWYEKVVARGELKPSDTTFFNITDDIADDKVEILRWFDKINDEFHIVVNGILITETDSKLSTRRKDGELGFWKAVYEPFGPHFFYGRSLPDLMMDNQDAIDFLFESMFDQTMLSTLKPIFTTGVNELMDDYLQPARIYTVAGAGTDSMWQPDIKGPDNNAFKVIQELKTRQDFISVDRAFEGAAGRGTRTATEVEAMFESAKKIMGLFTVLLKDALQFKAKLRAGTIMQYMLKNSDIKPIILSSVRLFNGKEGTRILKLKPEKEISPRNLFGFSKPLAMEAAMTGEPELTEITEMPVEKIRNFEFDVGVRVPSTVEMSDALQASYDSQFVQIAHQFPQIYNQRAVARIHAKAMKQKPEEVVLGEGEEPEIPLEEGGAQTMTPPTPAKPIQQTRV